MLWFLVYLVTKNQVEARLNATPELVWSRPWINKLEDDPHDSRPLYIVQLRKFQLWHDTHNCVWVNLINLVACKSRRQCGHTCRVKILLNMFNMVNSRFSSGWSGLRYIHYHAHTKPIICRCAGHEKNICGWWSRHSSADRQEPSVDMNTECAQTKGVRPQTIKSDFEEEMSNHTAPVVCV